MKGQNYPSNNPHFLLLFLKLEKSKRALLGFDGEVEHVGNVVIEVEDLEALEA